MSMATHTSHTRTKKRNAEQKSKNSPSLKQQKLNLFFATSGSNSNKSKLVRGESPEKIKNEVINSNQTDNNQLSIDSPILYYDISEGRNIIKRLFSVEMPEDFYSFWSFCQSILPEHPSKALESACLLLVGPYDILANPSNKFLDIDSHLALRHWRYYYDPPEFHTVIRCNDTNLLHFGYFRDDPEKDPVFVASNSAAKNGIICPNAENLFGAVNSYLIDQIKSAEPFKKTELLKLKSALNEWSEKNNFTLDTCTKKMRERNKAVVCRTFHGAGIVVPYNKKTQLGYRPLAENPDNLKKILNGIESNKSEAEKQINLDKLNEIITWTNIAVDEGDFGTSLELGLDLFCFGGQSYKRMIIQLLTSAYTLLNRPLYATIIKAHLEDRKTDENLSTLI